MSTFVLIKSWCCFVTRHIYLQVTNTLAASVVGDNKDACWTPLIDQNSTIGARRLPAIGQYAYVGVLSRLSGILTFCKCGHAY